MRDIGFKTPTILQLRLERLLQGSITNFNIQMFYISSLLYNPYEDGFNKAINNILEDGFDKAIGNILKDFQILRLIVYFCFNILSKLFLLILTLASI